MPAKRVTAAEVKSVVSLRGVDAVEEVKAELLADRTTIVVDEDAEGGGREEEEGGVRGSGRDAGWRAAADADRGWAEPGELDTDTTDNSPAIDLL